MRYDVADVQPGIERSLQVWASSVSLKGNYSPFPVCSVLNSAVGLLHFAVHGSEVTFIFG